MTIVGIDHVQVAMPAGGEDAAVAFWVGLLGLVQVAKPVHLAARGGCWFASGTVHIHVGVDPDFAPARKAHVGLLVEDLAGLRERLDGADHPTTDGDPLEGYIRADVHDPFGNRIELLERV